MVKLKKGDLFLMAGVLLTALILVLFVLIMKKENGTYVVVTCRGEEYGRYLLSQEQTIIIGKEGANELTIMNHTADMTKADCRDQLCVKQQAVKAKGEVIICVPNQIVVTVEGQ